MSVRVDISGKKYGKLLAVKCAKYPNWIFRCQCGKEKSIRLWNVTKGFVTSCGCLSKDKEFLKTRGLAIRKHGLSKCQTPEYKVWLAMKARCYTSTNGSYFMYGSRGIKVCKEWRDNYFQFLKDMGKKPTPEHSLDRIDSNGDYSQQNCRWSTSKEQARNTRRNIMFNGEYMIDAAKRLKISRDALSKRIKSGWSLEKTFNTPKIT